MKYIKNEFKRIKDTSAVHIIAALIAAALGGIYALTRSPMDQMSLSPLNWGLVFVIPFAPLFLFYILVRRPKPSVFRFTKWMYYICVPFMPALMTDVLFPLKNAGIYTDRFYSRFLPVWVLLWWIGTAAEYILMRAAEGAVRKGFENGSFGARFTFAIAAMYTPQKTISRKKRIGKGKWVIAVLCMIMLALAVFIGTVTLFLHNVYSNMEFEAILFTITFAAGGLAWEDLAAGTALTVLFIAVTVFFCYNLLKCIMNNELVVADTNKDGRYTLTMNGRKRAVLIAVSAVMLIGNAALFSGQTRFIHYVNMKLERSEIYDKYYVSPDDSVVVFPEKKRNLIYIYLESIENTYASKEAGGSQDKNYISRLTELTKDKDSVSFSNTEKLGGASVFVPSISHTQGSTVAQTSGITMNTQLSQFYKEPEYASVVRLEDILHDNGYEQLYIEGSKGEFSLYDKYVGRYEDSRIFDRKAAEQQGYIDEGADYMWKWGIEDKKLIEISKQLITEMSQKDKPFFVTMYTMDTHTFESGHRCSNCDSSIANDYLAAVDCTSRQIADFVDWIKQQPFYENTTVILVGDHLGNKKTIKVDIDDAYVRTTFNCIINPAKEAVKTQNRVFSSLDMFPTTLSAIGAQIKGDRLGLGTDLFSSSKTLCEVLGKTEYKKQLEQTSDYYIEKFFGKQKKS